MGMGEADSGSAARGLLSPRRAKLVARIGRLTPAGNALEPGSHTAGRTFVHECAGFALLQLVQQNRRLFCKSALIVLAHYN